MSFAEQDFFGQALQDALEVLQKHSDGDLNNVPDAENHLTHFQHCLQTSASFLTESTTYNWKNSINTEADLYPVGGVYQALQTVAGNPEMCITTPQQKNRKGKKKVRLYEYLHESLHNPSMANCIQWIDKPNGVFQFVSKNKEKLAEQWGERKGNRKIMTYQKMARALRNYGRTGEIIKIRRKLTYQFGAVVLQRLSLPYLLGIGEDVNPFAGDVQEYQYPDDWLSYHYYTCNKACSNTAPFYFASK